MVRRTLALLALAALLLAGAPPAGATADVQVTRLAGADRYGTAAAIAGQRPGAPQIVLARGDVFPDALVAAGVSMQYSSPAMLLTERDRIPQATLDVLRPFADAPSGAGFVHIMGDATAVGDAVERQLRDLGYSTIRHAGETRYETAAKAATANPEDPTRQTILVSGTSFADALAAGPLAWAERRAILLTTPDRLHPAARDAMASDVVIVGGTAAVSAAVEAEVRATGRAVTRIAGPNRQATAIAVAERLRATSGFPMTGVRLARGDDFPDALAAGADSGARKLPIVFTESRDALGETSRAWLAANSSTIASIEILGGPAAVGAGPEQEARAAAATAPAAVPVQEGATARSSGGGGGGGSSRARTTTGTTTTTTTTTAPAADPVDAVVEPVVSALTSPLALGVTHTQHSFTGSGAAVQQAALLLASRPGTLQNQHLMGWGARNPEPSPGAYDWTDLDRRIGWVRATGGTPVITLCCSPDWMKGGEPGTTDWSRLEVAPSPEHFDDFAELARQTALRYRDVKHFQVWNEMKGFWDAARNRWRYEDYTALYNQVYRALKSVDPTIQVGGPYVHLNSLDPTSHYASDVRGPWGAIDRRDLDVVSYWLRNAEGADFVTVDGSLSVRGRGLVVPAAEATAKLAAAVSWIRERTDLPVWWAELYPTPYGNAAGLTEVEQAASLTAALGHLATAGASAALYWEPEGRAGTTMAGLWSSTTTLAGGLPTLLHAVAAPWMRPLRG